MYGGIIGASSFANAGTIALNPIARSTHLEVTGRIGTSRKIDVNGSTLATAASIEVVLLRRAPR